MDAPRPSELALAIGILEGRYATPDHLLHGPTHQAEGDDLVHTQAEIPASTIALDAPGLRRTESVIARMVELRRPESVRRLSGFFAAIGGFFLEELPGRLRLFRSPARRVRRRSMGMGMLAASPLAFLARQDGATKIALIAAPYVLALAVAALLLERQQREAGAPIALAPMPSPAAAALAPATLEDPRSAESAGDSEPSHAVVPAPTSASLRPSPERATTRLAWPVRLQVRPSGKSARVASIPARAELEIIDGLELRPDWVLVRSVEDGAVGYLDAQALESPPPSERARERSSRRSKRARRARSAF